MTRLRHILQWTVGIVCGAYLAITIAMLLPSVQRMAGDFASSAMHNAWGWDIKVKKVRMGFGLRLILDEVTLMDKQNVRMLHASRLAVKPDFWGIIQGRVSLDNAQLFGTQMHLYQSRPECKPNFQFVLDTFKSKKKKKKPLDLRIGTLIVRRVAVTWDRQWLPRKSSGRFDVNHLSLSDMTLTAYLNRITEDTCDVKVRRFSVAESCGLRIASLNFTLKAGRREGRLTDFNLALPHSHLSIPDAEARYYWLHDRPVKLWLPQSVWKTSVELELAKADIAPFVNLPKGTPDGVRLSIDAEGSRNKACLTRVYITTLDKKVRLSASATISNLSHEPIADIRLKRLYFDHEWTGLLPVKLGVAQLDGRMSVSRRRISADLALNSDGGRATLKGELTDMNHVNATVQTSGIDIRKVLGKDNFPVGYIAATIKADGEVKAGDGKPDFDISIDAPTLTLLGYKYHNASVRAHYNSTGASLLADVTDDNGSVSADLHWRKGVAQSLDGHINLDRLAADQLGLYNRYSGTRTSADVDIALAGSSLGNLTGSVDISGLLVQTYRQDSILTGPVDIALSTNVNNGVRTTSIESVPLRLTATGRYGFATLSTTALALAHRVMPLYVKEQSKEKSSDQIAFSIELQDTTLLTTLLKTRIYVPEKATLEGWMDGGICRSELSADIPYMDIAGQRFRGTRLEINSDGQLAKADLRTERLAKKSTLPLSLNASAIDGKVRTQLAWDSKAGSGSHGTVDMTTTFPRYPDGSRSVNAWIAPTEISIADTVWQINPATLTWHEGALTVQGINIAQSGSGLSRDKRSIRIDGRMSRNVDDTLSVELSRINLEYVMNLVNFHSVEFAGEVTGLAKVSGLMTNPTADADIRMEHFMFNSSDQGPLMAHVNWGNTPHHLQIDAHISDGGKGEDTDVNGWVRLGDRPRPDAIDLRIRAGRFNLAFLNFFTNGIMDNVEGCTTGHVRVFGPLKKVDLEGELCIDTAHMSIPVLGTAYAMHRDSVHLRPGEIVFDLNAIDKNRHRAKVTGTLAHRNFKDLRYAFQIDADHLLGYDFPDFGDNPFAAHVVATGKVALKGEKGRLTVDMNLTPNAGTFFTYDVSKPDALTQAEFVHFKKVEKVEKVENVEKPSETSVAVKPSEAALAAISADLYLNFNMQFTPDAKIRLLVDKKSGETIEIQGSGRMMANFYNKGAFRMYGTYRVSDGNYNINVQDVIRKDFRFQKDGTITFGGDPMQAELNLYAVHTVPNVSLNDLTTQSLGFAKTKVNCIMHLTGKPQQPQISFDFDLPAATEDERKMVRAMVSTEEERNMQAIYLLGLGRFYSYSENTTGRSQSSMAVNSLVSSTLSSQLNQFISNAVGTTKWNFGANLKTGDDGWNNMDVEGQVSGSLLNDRLQVTGNFGYREKYYTQRNVVTDVDVEYLLTKSGSVALKAYNQANDRYFVQSSLNTQGIGIVLKKDFNHFTDIFKRKSRK